MSEKLTGVIERITFHNLDNGYCVLKVQARGHRDVVTVIGHLLQAVAGEFIEADGDWETDRTHGQQFKSTQLRTTPPHTTEGLIKYLGSGLVKGIGPTYAKKIVDTFGNKTLDVIDQSPSTLGEIRGIGPKRVALIRDSWKQNQGAHKIYTFLQSYGLGTNRAVRIYKQYGDTAIEQVRANPYRLSSDIWGVGFRTADDLALKMGIPRDAPQRIQAAIQHVLQEAASDGHVGLPEAVLEEMTTSLTEVPVDLVKQGIETLRQLDEIITDNASKASGGCEPPVSPCDHTEERNRGLTPPARHDDNDSYNHLIYLKKFYLAEVGVAVGTIRVGQGQHPLPSVNVEKALAWVETKMGIQFAPAQRLAVQQAVTKKLSVLTGGPGTGKTTIVRAILEIFRAKSLRVMLAAPTGRAAKRLGEACNHEAKTIHRLLEFDPAIGSFRRTADNPLDIDLLVVDEMSMADVMLANQLLRAIPSWACVVLVGDVDQLPSVGAGSVLKDLISSEVVPVVRLTEIHRQAGASYIIQAAHAINRGEEPDSAPPGQGDFFFIEAEEPEAVIDRILQMVKERIPAKFNLDPVRDVQILTPMNKTTLGVTNLNNVLQNSLNPQAKGKKEVQRYSVTFRVGDKVIQMKNNYQREVFNGDIGRIMLIDDVEQIVTVEIDGRGVEYEFNDLDELQLAYAISIHKSQGSEYPAVIIPLHTQHFVMLQRNLIYTGITRGRKLVVVVGSKRAMWIAVNKSEQSRRFTLLPERLKRTLLAEE